MTEIVNPPGKGERPITYPFARTGGGQPGAAETIEVAPGVHWIRMPLPFALNHINLWLLEDADGWTLIDSGMWLDETKGHWRRLFADKRIGAAHGKPVKKVIVTHFHPDHMGLAAWLTAEHGTELWITRTEWLMCRMLCMDSDASNHQAIARFYASHGLNEEHAREMFARGNSYRARTMQAPPSYRRLRDGERIRIGGNEWRIIVGTGHSPEHACLYCEALGLLISGDQILPKITPNISVWASEPEANPLQDYIDSLDRFAGLPADTLVLPSHNIPFIGLPARLEELRHHHDDRLGALLGAFGDTPLQAAELIPVLFRRELDLHQLGFAMGETLAHLHKLVGDGRVEHIANADGTNSYRRLN